MSKSTKSQFYRQTLRTAGSEGQICTSRVYLYPVPPQDALTIEGLFMHLRFVFDSSITTADQVLESIGISDTRPFLYNQDPTNLKKMVLNLAADGNRRIDIKLDLTHLLTKENVAFTPLLSADYTTGGLTLIQLKLPNRLQDTLAVATIELWKVDALYTTREIR